MNVNNTRSLLQLRMNNKYVFMHLDYASVL